MRAYFMRCIIHTGASIAALTMAAACGSAAPLDASAPTPSSRAEKPDEVSASADPPAKGGELTETALRAMPSLKAEYPDIAAVEQDLGKPTKSGTTLRVSWLYASTPFGRGYSCSSVDAVESPTGGVFFIEGAPSGEVCKDRKTTREQASKLMTSVKGQAFGDEAIAVLMDGFDQQAASSQVPFAYWKYVDGEGKCKHVIVTKDVRFQLGQAVFDIPCD